MLDIRLSNKKEETAIWVIESGTSFSTTEKYRLSSKSLVFRVLVILLCL